MNLAPDLQLTGSVLEGPALACDLGEILEEIALQKMS